MSRLSVRTAVVFVAGVVVASVSGCGQGVQTPRDRDALTLAGDECHTALRETLNLLIGHKAEQIGVESTALGGGSYQLAGTFRATYGEEVQSHDFVCRVVPDSSDPFRGVSVDRLVIDGHVFEQLPGDRR